MTTTTPRAFKIHVSDEQLMDLRRRVGATRWPDEQDGVGWEQGLPVATARELADRWVNRLDWRGVEARLNRFEQLLTVAAGARVHAVHVRAEDPRAPALVLLHGWPSTFADYAQLIEPLSEHFHVVAPSLPGFAFSGPTPGMGWSTRKMADAIADLMRQLGYTRYGVHGSDMGALVGRWLGIDHAEHVTLLHACGFPGMILGDDELTDAERERGAGRSRYMSHHSGYAMQQSQAPQTLGYALTDSPIGQLAWVAEKLLWAWPDPETPIDRDAVLTTVGLYWHTATATSSARAYWEAAHDGTWWRPPEPSSTPTAIAVFPNGLAGSLPIRRLYERSNTIVRWTEFDRGGHFPALEVPELLRDELVDVFLDTR